MTTNTKSEASSDRFRELEVWQRAMKLARESYSTTDSIPKCEMFRLRGEIRRTAMSVQTEIARGHQKNSEPELSNSLGHAIESLSVLEAEIKVAETAGYVKAGDAEQFNRQCEEVAAMIREDLRAHVGDTTASHQGSGHPGTPGDVSAS